MKFPSVVGVTGAFWEGPDALLNLRDLIVYLDSQEDGELDRKDLLYVLEKPWKWQTEYNAMRAKEWLKDETRLSAEDIDTLKKIRDERR